MLTFGHQVDAPARQPAMRTASARWWPTPEAQDRRTRRSQSGQLRRKRQSHLWRGRL